MKKKLRTPVMWFLMFCKRLLYRPGFLLLLAMIPLTVLAIRLGVSDDSGVLRIGLYSEDTQAGRKIVHELLEADSIISFTEYASVQEARQAVLEGRIQGAWIFPSDLESRIERNASLGTLKPLVKVIEREESIPLQLSHEVLYGKLHPYVSYENYSSFIKKEYGDIRKAHEDELRYHYDKSTELESVIEIRVTGSEKKAEINTNILVLPLRGMLSVMMVLCGLASMMFFLDDRGQGKFDRMPAPKHIIPAFGSCLAGTALSGIAVSVSLVFSGIGTDFFSELTAMLLYIFCVCGFCLVCGMLCKNAARLGAFTPFLIIILLALCPIFIDMGTPFGRLLPSFHYLYALYDVRYMLNMAVYAVASVTAAFVINAVICKLPHISRER